MNLLNFATSPAPLNSHLDAFTCSRRSSHEHFEESLQYALNHFQAGRMSEAASTCQTILESDPDNAAALNLMAVIAVELGQTDTATKLGHDRDQLRHLVEQNILSR
ncbi:MAG: tetratricopeptide repeat protein, partial [Alphaproteobacteria bacterium]|nr:tetratricopeptide repeat protein [Alphaproteobacteria bacterium]